MRRCEILGAEESSRFTRRHPSLLDGSRRFFPQRYRSFCERLTLRSRASSRESIRKDPPATEGRGKELSQGHVLLHMEVNYAGDDGTATGADLRQGAGFRIG